MLPHLIVQISSDASALVLLGGCQPLEKFPAGCFGRLPNTDFGLQ